MWWQEKQHSVITQIKKEPKKWQKNEVNRKQTPE
jgi:hypothetical protein